MSNRIFAPRPGGLQRLRAKIEQVEQQSHLETRMMAVAASVLVVLLVGTLNWARQREPGFDLVRMEQTTDNHPVEIPTGTPGVRYLWVMN